MWNILKRQELDVLLPSQLTRETMYPFINQAIDENADARCGIVSFDFSRISWVEPVGIVTLSNLLEYLRKAKVKVRFKNHTANSPVIRYLDDSMFFNRYIGKKIFDGSDLRSTTIPLTLVDRTKVIEFLGARFIPWVGNLVDIDSDSLATIKMCLEEIFLNINHHSEVTIGCVYAQHFPQKHQIKIAISDFGVGIPTTVRRKIPELDDRLAIIKACEEGFTTQSNVRNRGAGIPNLFRYVTKANKGKVIINSGRASIIAYPDGSDTKVTAKSTSGFYPGTLVDVLLRTDTLEQVVSDVQPEDFSW